MIRHAADLFCGAGGTSTGYVRACLSRGMKPELFALNHNPQAVRTHELNHPGVRHLCEEIDRVRPQEAIPGGHLHILCASPECTGFSLAAGGAPKNDQSRAQAWQVLRWATDLTIDNILIENVREFQGWCRLLQKPLRWRGKYYSKGKPDPRFKGEYFRAFIEALRNLGYTVEFRMLCAADYGDPTTRQRLFIMARRNQPIAWPKPTHERLGVGLPKWRAAREIIDWDLKGTSIFRRARPLSANTMRRIAAGLRKFGGEHAEPFLVMLYGTNDARSVDRPAPTVTANGTHIGLAEPFVIGAGGPTGAGTPRAVSDPLNTVTTDPHQALVQPFIVPPRHMNEGTADSVEDPLRTVVGASARNFGLVQPFVVHSTHHGERAVHGMAAPLPTVTGAHRGEMALVEPFTTMLSHNNELARSVDEPVQTVTTARGGEIALVQPFVVKYYGTGGAVGVDEPLDTVTTRDRFMLLCPTTHEPIAELDILFRMLQPHELAAAQGFPPNYQFAGTREQRVKQIGNAVPVNLATALCGALLS